MSQSDEIIIHEVGHVGTVMLNRPQALNALTLTMVRQLHPHLQVWARDDAISHVIVRAAGDRAFCAGGDIRALYLWAKANNPIVTQFY